MKSLTYVEIDVPAFGDVQNTNLLLHMDGVNGSTDFVDSSGEDHSVTAFGSAHVTSQPNVFGQSLSLGDPTLDGYLQIPNSPQFTFGANDFTIDTWVSLRSTTESGVVAAVRGTTTTDQSWMLWYSASQFDFRFYAGSTGTSVNDITGTTFIAPFSTTDLFVHLAIVRKGDQWTFFFNGTPIGALTSALPIFGSTADLTIGNRSAGESGLFFDGWIDEFRISNVARWDGEFTPPTLPWPAGMLQTLRFSEDADYYPKETEAIPSLQSVSFTPATISLGEDLGKRATVSAVFKDHKHIQGSEPYDQGSYWGKFRGRYGLRLRGRPFRLIRGFVGQPIAEMETHHYIIEASDGPKPQDGSFTLTAKDVLKLADGDRAQAPRLSNGFLVTDISTGATSATLSPSGIGDAEYPTSGWVAIGGEEIAAFTRSGDTLTLTRGQLGTAASAHDAEDRVQLVLRYEGEDPADIIRDLFVTYADVDPNFIDLEEWKTETGSFLQRIYTATIAEPTSVKTLISELIEQAALAIWWDDITRKIRLQVLREIATTASVFDESTILAGSLDSTEQPDTRISQVWVYYGQRNPLLPVDETDNYRSVEAVVDTIAEQDYGGPAVKKIFSRWIPAFGRSVAQRAAEILLARYVDPPRRFSFDTFRVGGAPTVNLGGGYRLASWPLQDDMGNPTNVPIQVTRLNPMADRFAVEAEEMLFSAAPVDLVNRVIIIDSNSFNLNLKDIHDTLFPPVTPEDVAASPPVNLTCIIESGVIVGGLPSPNFYSFNVDDGWPPGFHITLVVRGRIQGRGGNGGEGAADNGNPGRHALFTRFPIDLDVASGEIWGGGGGGGASPQFAGGVIHGGGGGAGQVPGTGGDGFNGGDDGDNGTTEQGGDSPAGDGGGPGESGEDDSGDGGAAGFAIDGESFVNIIAGPGDIRGPQIN